MVMEVAMAVYRSIMMTITAMVVKMAKMTISTTVIVKMEDSVPMEDVNALLATSVFVVKINVLADFLVKIAVKSANALIMRNATLSPEYASANLVLLESHVE